MTGSGRLQAAHGLLQATPGGDTSASQDVVPVCCYSTVVADDQRTHRSARARAVAELPVEPLLTRVDELARRWAIALIRERPLESIGEVPLERLAQEAPTLCAQLLRAVQSDVELQRLTGAGPGGREQAAVARRLSSICGARAPAALVGAVESLRGVLWEALLDQLAEPTARLLADVGDRLAYVCASLLAAAVGSVLATGSADDAVELDPQTAAAQELRRLSSPHGEVTIVDERAAVVADARAVVTDARAVADAQASADAAAAADAPALADAPAPEHAWGGSRSWDEPRSVADGGALAEIEIRDERREEGPAAWISLIGAQLQRFERDGAPFAVLLVELLDSQRLRRQETPEELARLGSRLEQALASALGRWSGSLARELPGRCWLLAPESDRAAAERLAQRLMRDLQAGDGGGMPLAVAIGTAVCPEDGREPAALAAIADVGLYARRSALRASPVRRVATPVDESA
jgi:GGDEF domain-containing protein